MRSGATRDCSISSPETQRLLQDPTDTDTSNRVAATAVFERFVDAFPLLRARGRRPGRGTNQTRHPCKKIERPVPLRRNFQQYVIASQKRLYRGMVRT